ncbi:MAG: cell division protein FtsL [Cyclobacteriaceae bacterium]|jgi:cell division protein FtsL
MATNTFKIPSKSQSRGGFSTLIERFLRIDNSLSEVIHVRFLSQIFYVSFLCIIYIGNRHHAEKKIRTINKLETTISDLRADYTTLNASFKFSSKQSEVAKQASKLGLKESNVPPYKIILKEE